MWAHQLTFVWKNRFGFIPFVAFCFQAEHGEKFLYFLADIDRYRNFIAD